MWLGKCSQKWYVSKSENERKKEDKARDGQAHVTLCGCALQQPFNPFAADRHEVAWVIKDPLAVFAHSLRKPSESVLGVVSAGKSVDVMARFYVPLHVEEAKDTATCGLAKKVLWSCRRAGTKLGARETKSATQNGCNRTNVPFLFMP